MEFMGHTQTASYLTGPRLGASRSPCFLPDITAPIPLNKSAQYSTSSRDRGEIYPIPTPLRRSMTTLESWRPGVFYQTAKVNPSSAITRSMPEPNSYKNYLYNLDHTKVPTVFGNARHALYTRYSPEQWKSSNVSNWVNADTVRSAGERMRLEAVRLVNEADEKTKAMQEEAGKRLGERINDIDFWKRELQDETDKLLDETHKLEDQRRILEKNLKETEGPLKIAQECLYNREKRHGIDLVHDDPEAELIDEVDAIKKCQEKLRGLFDGANTQLSLNRAAQHELERDTDDKHSALNIDKVCHNLKNTSRGITFHNGVERMDNSQSVPETWCHFTEDNIKRSASERDASKALRNKIDNEIEQVLNDMWDHWNRANEALTRRVAETNDAKNKIQTHLGRVMQEIFDMEKHIELLKKAIQDKEGPLKVAQTRLQTRGYRPNVEACRDSAQHRLVDEVHGIYETVEALHHKLAESQNHLQQLLRSKSALEKDLEVKNNSLFIDREKCLALRKQFPMTPKSALVP